MFCIRVTFLQDEIPAAPSRHLRLAATGDGLLVMLCHSEADMPATIGEARGPHNWVKGVHRNAAGSSRER